MLLMHTRSPHTSTTIALWLTPYTQYVHKRHTDGQAQGNIYCKPSQSYSLIPPSQVMQSLMGQEWKLKGNGSQSTKSHSN
jgi:hypothetical protein